MPVNLTLIDDSGVPIDASPLQPAALAELTESEIARLPIRRGRRTVPCGELFRISGTAKEDRTVCFEEMLPAVHGIGANLTEGTIRVVGEVGIGLAKEMGGGEVFVEGNVGDGAAMRMSGGRLIVRGNVGNSLAAAGPGDVRGMTGGEIFVFGNVGHEAATAMRRGTIVIEGDCGDGAAVGMIAGTLVVGGNLGSYPGAMMRRGTIVVHGSRPLSLLPTFSESTTHPPDFLRLLGHVLNDAVQGIPTSGQNRLRVIFAVPVPPIIRSWRGDRLELGLGEIYQLGTN